MMCMISFDGTCMNYYGSQGRTLVIYPLFYYTIVVYMAFKQRFSNEK